MCLHTRTCGKFDGLRVAFLTFTPLGNTPSLRQIAMNRIMRAGLIGYHVRPDTAVEYFLEYVGGVTNQADRLRFIGRCPFRNQVERLIERMSLVVDIPRSQAKIDT